MLRKFLSLLRKPAKAPAAQPVARARRAAVPSWHSTRGPKLEMDKTLLPYAQHWLTMLPEDARPAALCSAYPRIVNRFAMIWTKRPAMKSYFDDLLIDKRGGRIGFSPEIAAEIARLRAFYETAMPDARAVREWKERMIKASGTSPPAPAKVRK